MWRKLRLAAKSRRWVLLDARRLFCRLLATGGSGPFPSELEQADREFDEQLAALSRRYARITSLKPVA